jgi:hypothetical protein
MSSDDLLLQIHPLSQEVKPSKGRLKAASVKKQNRLI